jgi:hypothetical protein
LGEGGDEGRLEVVYSMLDDAQKKMLDRRLLMSQTEPLGR